MWSGDDQALEGWMIPSCIMCSNLILAAQRRSGGNCWGRAETGRPVVSMWCAMLCSAVFTGVQTLVKSAWEIQLTVGDRGWWYF